MVPEDLRRIDTALDRDRELAVPEEVRLAGTAVVPGNFLVGQSVDRRGRTGIAVARNKDHPALAAFAFPAADTLDLDAGSPDGGKDRGPRCGHDLFFHGVEEDPVLSRSSYLLREPAGMAARWLSGHDRSVEKRWQPELFKSGFRRPVFPEELGNAGRVLGPDKDLPAGDLLGLAAQPGSKSRDDQGRVARRGSRQRWISRAVAMDSAVKYRPATALSTLRPPVSTTIR